METFEWSAQETEIYIRTTAACVDQTPRGYPCLGWGLQDATTANVARVVRR